MEIPRHSPSHSRALSNFTTRYIITNDPRDLGLLPLSLLAVSLSNPSKGRFQCLPFKERRRGGDYGRDNNHKKTHGHATRNVILAAHGYKYVGHCGEDKTGKD